MKKSYSIKIIDDLIDHKHFEKTHKHHLSQKENLISEVTDAMVRAIDAPKDRVRVIITEMPKTHFGIGGESASKVKK